MLAADSAVLPVSEAGAAELPTSGLTAAEARIPVTTSPSGFSGICAQVIFFSSSSMFAVLECATGGGSAVAG